MFETLPGPSLEMMLIAGRAMLLIGAFWVFALAFIRWRRADERNAQRLHQQFERAFAEVRSLHETVSVMSARLESLSERAEVDARLAPAGAAGTQRGYDLATRMAKNGADIEQLILSCGITRHEAELLVRLHSARSEKLPRSAAPAGWNMPPPAQPAPAARPAPTQNVGKKRGSLLSVVG